MFTFRLNQLIFVLFVSCLAAGCSKKMDTPEAVVKAYYEAVATADLRHDFIDKKREKLGVVGDASKILELYDLEGFSSKDLAVVKERVVWSAFQDKREFIKEGGLEKLEVLGIDETGQDKEGQYSLVKVRFIFKNDKTQEQSHAAYQRGKEYKLVFPKAVLKILAEYE